MRRTIAESLEGAKALLVTRGWGQGANTIRPDGPYCVATALVESGGVTDYDEMYRIFSMIVGTENLVSWNDDPLRNVEDVLDAFDRAILRAREDAMVRGRRRSRRPR